MFLVNSRHYQFTAAPSGYMCNTYTQRSTPSSEVTGLFCRVPWPEFSRAPWIIHPTHLSWFAVRSAASKLRRFSWQCRLNSFRPCGHGLASRISPADLPAGHSYPLAPGHPTPGLPTLLRPSIALRYRYGNINPFPINYGFRPRLRGRLTPGRLPLPGKPWVFGEQVFHLFYRYSCQHNHLCAVQMASQPVFNPHTTLPYR